MEHIEMTLYVLIPSEQIFLQKIQKSELSHPMLIILRAKSCRIVTPNEWYATVIPSKIKQCRILMLMLVCVVKVMVLVHHQRNAARLNRLIERKHSADTPRIFIQEIICIFPRHSDTFGQSLVKNVLNTTQRLS
jgi:hypothetical protein